LIKSGFSRGLPGDEPRSRSKLAKRCGSADIGNMRFATKPILPAILITFTSTL
jgi:hypothetical protein